MTWYATKAVMLHIEHLQKTYYCPIKKNRLVDDSGGENPYQRVDALTWTKREQDTGKRMKLRGFPKNHQGERIPGCISYGTHGVYRNQRLDANRPVGGTSGVPLALED